MSAREPEALDGEQFDEATTQARLQKAWQDAPGLWGWLTTVDHKRVAQRYLVTSFVFFALAGFAAAAMRLQAGMDVAIRTYAFDVKPRWPLEAVGAAESPAAPL